MCSGTSVSAGTPVYLTSDSYPEVPTGDSTCSCSYEVYSCTSSINMYIIDADMYSDVDNCEQKIELMDGRNISLDTIDCQSYYRNEIVSKQFTTTNYIKINYIDNSAENREGLVFIGLEGNVALFTDIFFNLINFFLLSSKKRFTFKIYQMVSWRNNLVKGYKLQ